MTTSSTGYRYDINNKGITSGYKFAVMIKTTHRLREIRERTFGIINGYIDGRISGNENLHEGTAGDVSPGKKVYRRDSVYRNDHYYAD